MYISDQKEVNEQFGRKVNKDVNGNRKLFKRRCKGMEFIEDGG